MPMDIGGMPSWRVAALTGLNSDWARAELARYDADLKILQALRSPTARIIDTVTGEAIKSTVTSTNGEPVE